MTIALAGALIRLYSVLSHRGQKRHALWMSGYGILIALFIALFPKPVDQSSAGQVKFADVKRIIDARCTACHAAKPNFAGFVAPPKNVVLETPDQIKVQAQVIYQQVVVTKAMPIGNLTKITDEERARIADWVGQGAKLD
jgi:uncharacterized membrane protein